MKRREGLRYAGCSIAALCTGGAGSRIATAGSGDRWDVREVIAGDAAELVALMRACVEGEHAFHGRCNGAVWDRVGGRRTQALAGAEPGRPHRGLF